jgi:hypothetical protein
MPCFYEKRYAESRYENFKASFRRRLARKTRLVTQDLAKERRNQTPFHDPEGRREISLFLQGLVRTSVDHMTTSIFSTMYRDDLLGKEYFDSEETLNQHQLHYFCKINSCSRNVALLRRHLRKKFICRKYSIFLDEDRNSGLFEILFSARRHLQNANDNVVSYHKDSVAASLDLGI